MLFLLVTAVFIWGALFLSGTQRKKRREPSLEIPTFEAGSRPLWPEVWMAFANIISRRSYDPRTKVGCIIVAEDNTQCIAVGYNGRGKGVVNEPKSLEPGCSGMTHAEINCLIKSPHHYPLKKHMYVTTSPCPACAEAILNGNISRVVYGSLYRDTAGIDILKQHGVEVYSLQEAIDIIA